jgi:hypothetical protein
MVSKLSEIWSGLFIPDPDPQHWLQVNKKNSAALLPQVTCPTHSHTHKP